MATPFFFLPMYAICWLRRDLRLHDQAALFAALQSGLPVLPLFIFDSDILEQLPQTDARVDFIHTQLSALDAQLRPMGCQLLVAQGRPLAVWAELLEALPVSAVYFNRDYEPYARQRDRLLHELLMTRGVSLHTYGDQTVFGPQEVLKADGTPYTVFTPYARRWKALLSERPGVLAEYATEPHFRGFARDLPLPLAERYALPPLGALGFRSSGRHFPAAQVSESLLRQYAQQRDFPSVAGTSRLSVHLRFGTLSIRALARQGMACSETWLNELIWREFYMSILYHFPRVVHENFNRKFDRMPWRQDQADFEAWCLGQTGFPLVDAGMRELNTTGFMHNRVRMLTASFLTKHLLLDWRWGEAYFAQKLLDYDLSANNGGWQWSAGTGTDAQPYFRVFNPITQAQKFDPEGHYIRHWVPEYGTPDYAPPIVSHEEGRARALAAWEVVRGA